MRPRENNNWKSTCYDHVPFYPGTGGNGGIAIFDHAIEHSIDVIINDNATYGFPQNSEPLRIEFYQQQLKRVIAHEFGHVLSIDHHCVTDNFTRDGFYAGDWDCVMKYQIPIADFPTNPMPWWTTFLQTFGEGYLDDDFDCLDQRALRPVDEVRWPPNHNH